MISFSVKEGRRWHCGALVRKLRPEQKAVAVKLGADAHRNLWEAYRRSGITRAWVSSEGRVLGLMGVLGPMLATDGMVWLALSEEATRYPIQIIKEAKKLLGWIMLFKHRLYADPFVADETSVRFAKRLGFIPLPLEAINAQAAREMGVIPMVLALNTEAYVERRVERVN
jgi:hypothetical protein